MLNKPIVFRIIFVVLSVLSIAVNFFVVPRFIEGISSIENVMIMKIVFIILVSITQLPLLFSFYHSYRLLMDVTTNKAFSESSLNRLSKIKYAILTVCLTYLIGFLVVLIIDYSEYNIIMVHIVLLFISLLLLSFAYLIEQLLLSAYSIKQEHVLTV